MGLGLGVGRHESHRPGLGVDGLDGVAGASGDALVPGGPAERDGIAGGVAVGTGGLGAGEPARLQDGGGERRVAQRAIADQHEPDRIRQPLAPFPGRIEDEGAGALLGGELHEIASDLGVADVGLGVFDNGAASDIEPKEGLGRVTGELASTAASVCGLVWRTIWLSLCVSMPFSGVRRTPCMASVSNGLRSGSSEQPRVGGSPILQEDRKVPRRLKTLLRMAVVWHAPTVRVKCKVSKVKKVFIHLAIKLKSIMTRQLVKVVGAIASL